MPSEFSFVTALQVIVNVQNSWLNAWVYIRGHQHGARGHQVARADHAGRPRACFENSIKMMGIVT